MPWPDLLTPAQRVQILELPASLREYEELYTLTPADLEFVAAHLDELELRFVRLKGALTNKG